MTRRRSHLEPSRSLRRRTTSDCKRDGVPPCSRERWGVPTRSLRERWFERRPRRLSSLREIGDVPLAVRTLRVLTTSRTAAEPPFERPPRESASALPVLGTSRLANHRPAGSAWSSGGEARATWGRAGPSPGRLSTSLAESKGERSRGRRPTQAPQGASNAGDRGAQRGPRPESGGLRRRSCRRGRWEHARSSEVARSASNSERAHGIHSARTRRRQPGRYPTDECLNGCIRDGTAGLGPKPGFTPLLHSTPHLRASAGRPAGRPPRPASRTPGARPGRPTRPPVARR
jgi:hypothetical protein